MLKLLKKIFSKNAAPDSADDKEHALAVCILERAMQEKASAILFGVPPGENYNREEHRLFSQEVDEETREFARLQDLELKEPESIEISSIPIFMKIEGKWLEVLDLPMALHSNVISTIKDYACEFDLAAMKINFPLGSTTVSFTFDTNENFNYLASDLSFHLK